MPKEVKTISGSAPVGIKDVARLAGVSPATVSRALSGGPISEALRKQVEDAVRASGYRPNLAARRLRSQHSGTVGLIVADIRNPFFTALSRAVEAAAYDAGLRVIFCNTDENPEREAMYLRLMQEERITGLIFAPTRTMLEQLDPSQLDCPVTLVDRVDAAGLYDGVSLDNRLSMDRLVDHLIANGYRRIGGLFGATSSTGLERRQGFVAAMQRHGLPAPFRQISPDPESGQREARDWLSQSERPEALIASNSLLLMGILKAARSLELTVPGDLAIAGFDNEPWTDLVEPGITVIEQPTDDIGRAAMTLLFERIKSPDQAVRRVVLGGKLIVRGSTARRA